MSTFATHLLRGYRRTTRFVVSSLLLVAIVFGAAFTVPAQKAEAQGIPVFDPTNYLANIISAIKSGSLELKEFQLDAIAYQIAQNMLRRIVQSTTDWVNSGFQGSPAFITNLREYLFDELDYVAGQIIHGDEGLAFLCEPFKLDIQFALQTYVQQSQGRDIQRTTQCTFSGAMENVQNFLNGDFLSGGWAMWRETYGQPQNNPWGAYALAQVQLDIRMSQTAAEKLRQADWANGFLSVEDCSGGMCRIVTPGNIIADRINSVLRIPENSLIQSDEINELISALMNQLAIQAMSGIRGLTGLSERQGGQPSYLEQIGNPQYDTRGDGSAIEQEAAFLGTFAGYEAQYASMHRPLLNRVIAAEAEAANAAVYCDAMEGPLASAAALRSNLQQTVSAADANAASLRALETRYQNATNSDERLAILYEFETLRGTSAMRTDVEIQFRQYEINNTVGPQVTNIENQIEDAIAQCEAFEEDI